MRWLRRLASRQVARQALELAGVMIICAGIWLWWPPAALVGFGAYMIVSAIAAGGE